MKKTQSVPKKKVLTSALLLALSGPAWAQEAAPAADAQQATVDGETTELDAITVVGIRASLQSSMNLKRDSQGIVDGIVAEDIGKFPDTNLAESLQRISGVSIDRSDIGEGSKITVRGVGPDYNLVLLNGRQMPASSIQATSASYSRAYDFANLASESISGIEVYKTSRAATPAGGMGATINVKTGRPLDMGTLANVGVKSVYDTSNGNLPDSLQGHTMTPEISGIFSQTFADGKFGVSFSGSYQDRNLGYNQAGVTSGWYTYEAGSGPIYDATDTVTNAPSDGQIYSVPQNINYSVNGVRRQRTNGQLTLQFAPTDNLTATLDYTYAENRVQTLRNELSAWFSFGDTTSAWGDGAVASPLSYGEIANGTYSDLAMASGKYATKNENNSLGFNVEWDATDSLSFEFDAHHSTAESSPDSIYGSNSSLGVAGYFRGTTVVDFSGEFPIMSVSLPEDLTGIDASAMTVAGTSFRNSYMKSEVDQIQGHGHFKFQNYSQLDFGVAATTVKNRSAYGYIQNGDWSGLGGPQYYPDEAFNLDDMANYFDQFSGSGSSAFSSQFFTYNFDTIRNAAVWYVENVEGTGRTASDFMMPYAYTTDQRVEEKSKSAYVQWSNTWDWAVPMHMAVGVRYEKTDVSSPAIVQTPVSVTWSAQNELEVAFEGSTATIQRGSYDYVLPNLDLSFDLRDNLILRASYGQSIGRPLWNEIQGGQTYGSLYYITSGQDTGELGNPGLEPLQSDNYDLSLEWYYGESSYLSVGYFRKDIDNYVTKATVETTIDGLYTPQGGTYWNEALASGCVTSDTVCIRNYIFTNHDGDPGVAWSGNVSETGEMTGTITGQPGDPEVTALVTVSTNSGSKSLDGWEINFQHMFGGSGFGVAANYTIVDSDLKFDNTYLGAQTPIVGLSDTANLVLFYEKGPWQIRTAYNWRDEYLASPNTDGRNNPMYVEAYGQLDANVSYQVSDNFTIFAEGINLTDETMRSHGRTKNELLFATQTGPRYMFGFRYKF